MKLVETASKLVETASKWGNGYNFRYYNDGVRITNRTFRSLYHQNGFTPNCGVMQSTDYGWRTTWFAK